MARFNVLVQAVPRSHHGQQFVDYWFLGRCWSGTNPTQAELDENQLKEIQDHEKAGYPIRVLEVAEMFASSPPPPSEVPPVVPSQKAAETPPPPVVPDATRPPWAPAV